MTRTQTPHSWWWLSVTVLAGSLAVPAPALADAASGPHACDTPQLRARIVEVRFSDGDGPIDIPLHPEIMTTVRIDARTTGATSAYIQGTIVSTTEHGLSLGVSQNVAARGILTAETTAGPVPFAVRGVTDPEEAIALALVRHRAPGEAGKPTMTVLGSVCSLETEIDTIASAVSKEKDAEYAAKLQEKDAERDRAVQDAEDKTLLVAAHSSKFRVIRLDRQACEGRDIAMCPDTFVDGDKHGVLKFWLHNRTGRDMDITDATAEVIDVDSGGHHAVLLRVTDELDRPISTIPRGTRAKASVLLREPELIGDDVKVVLLGTAPVLPAVRYMEIPDTWEWAEQERQKERREREAKRVQIQVMGSFGALFVPEVDGSDATDATSLMAASVRVIKGVTPMWAFEAEIAGGSSGETAALESAKLGRVMLGGRLRFGETATVWHARLGIGLQALRTSSTAAGTETEGSQIMAFGVGVDWRLGDQFTAGVSAGTSSRGFDRIQTIEAGIHFGLVLAP